MTMRTIHIQLLFRHSFSFFPASWLGSADIADLSRTWAAMGAERVFGGEGIRMEKRFSHSSADIGCIAWIVLIEEASW